MNYLYKVNGKILVAPSRKRFVLVQKIHESKFEDDSSFFFDDLNLPEYLVDVQIHQPTRNKLVATKVEAVVINKLIRKQIIKGRLKPKPGKKVDDKLVLVSGGKFEKDKPDEIVFQNKDYSVTLK